MIWNYTIPKTIPKIWMENISNTQETHTLFILWIILFIVVVVFILHLILKKQERDKHENWE